MVAYEIKLYELLKDHLVNEVGAAFVEILESKADKKFDHAKQTLATKEDIANLRTELKTDIANLRTELKKDFANLRAEMKSDKAEHIKRMSIFRIGQ